MNRTAPPASEYVVSDGKHDAGSEKGEFYNRETASSTSEQALMDTNYERRLVRKIDRRLLPILGALYSFALIDRTNLANARLNGAGTELGLNSGNHYTVANLVFFFPYILLEIPSNIAFRKVGAARWLGTIALLWGAVMIGMGFTTDWKQLSACRTILGVLEAGFFPACAYVITCWYTRRELQLRMSVFYLTSVVLASFGNIIAYGLAQIKVGNMSRWRWIFIVEGMVTCVLALIGYMVICDFPDKNTFLTKEETAFVIERVERDRGDSVHDPLTWRKALVYSLDLKIWVFGLMFMCALMPAYSYSYFFPIVLQGMGFSVRDAQILFAPAGVTACFVAVIVARLSDKYNQRGIFVAFNACLAITGVCMTSFSTHNGVRLAGGFFGYAGAQGNVPALLSYQSNNIRGQSLRAFSSAIMVGFGGIGGIFASTAYRQQDYPHYALGLWATLGCGLLTLVLVAGMTLWFFYRNRQASRGGKVI